MASLLLVLHSIAAILAIMFIVYYLRIILVAEEIGPAPLSWILFAVGSALIAGSAVLEAILAVEGMELEIAFHVQRVYFMLGNVVICYVLFRIWQGIGVTDG